MSWVSRLAGTVRECRISKQASQDERWWRERFRARREADGCAGGTETARPWRYDAHSPSLPEVHSSLPVPRHSPFLRKLLAYAGPGFLVSVGYMDPGNWATDLAGGSRFGYQLLFVIMLSNLMAILLQSLALKLGIVTGRDLAQACRDHYSRRASFALWVLAEVQIAACDLAEVIALLSP